MYVYMVTRLGSPAKYTDAWSLRLASQQKKKRPSLLLLKEKRHVKREGGLVRLFCIMSFVA